MKSLFCLALGASIGFVVAVGAMRYHLVRATDGMHLIPKRTAQLKEAYIDIREFDVAAWAEHEDLAMAVVEAEKSHLIAEEARHGLRGRFEGVLHSLQ